MINQMYTQNPKKLSAPSPPLAKFFLVTNLGDLWLGVDEFLRCFFCKRAFSPVLTRVPLRKNYTQTYKIHF